jgi:hypothetical protein
MGGDNALSQSSFFSRDCPEWISNLICNSMNLKEQKFSSENITQWAHLMHEGENIIKKKEENKWNCITLSIFYMWKESCQIRMYVFHHILVCKWNYHSSEYSLLSLFSLCYRLMSNEVDTQDDIDPLTHIAEWIIHGW